MRTDHVSEIRLEVKSYSDDQRYIAGMATTPTVDRMGDIVEPLGAKFEREIPLYLDHDSSRRVGRVRLGKPTAKGIPFEAWLPKVTEPGPLRDRVDTAWQEIKYGLVQAVSIGFRILNDAVERIKAGGFRFLETEILELSLVGVPAQPDARIQVVRSQLAALGHKHTARAGANPSPKGKAMKTYTQESLAGLQATRQTKAARMAELLELKDAESRDFSDDERTEFSGLRSEIHGLDDEIAVCEVHVARIATAKPVDGGRGPSFHVRKFKDVEPKFKGEEGLKRAQAHIVSMKELRDGNVVTPAQVFERLYGRTNPTMLQIMKSGVAGGGTDSGEWGAELVGVDNRYTGDFIEYLYGMTVFDALPLREVPANVAIKGQDGAFTGYFVGQSKAIKVSAGDFSSTSTIPYKAAGLTVVSNELLEDASPSALNIIGNGLREAVRQAVDSRFLSAAPLDAGVAPAGILAGISGITSNGGDAQSIITDVQALFAPFESANNDTGDFAWIMRSSTARALSMMRNALGGFEFPTVTPQGGTFLTYPVFIGNNVPAGAVVLIKGSDVWRIGDSGMRLSLSDSAMIEQDDSPTGATDTPTAASATMVSMFQEDSTAIRVVRRISWGKRRSGAVQWVTGAQYGAEQS